MSYRHVDASCLKVPGRMDLDELAFLAALAHQVPKHGHIVEVGAFYGRSTRALARGNPNARITSIDTFENVDWTRKYAARFSDVPDFGRAAFAQFTHDIANLDVIEGYSPACVHDWAQPIDLYFEDAVHGNPGLRNNMGFWIDRLKPGGIACGHDYTHRFPDIKREVDALAKQWNVPVALVGSLWALQKPPADHDGRAMMPKLSVGPQLQIETCNKTRGYMTGVGGYWTGAHLDADRLHWFKVHPQTSEITLEFRVGHPKFGDTPWIRQGQKVRLVKDGKVRPFTRLAVRLVGNETGAQWHVIYRASARQIGNGGARVTGTSSWAHDGSWASLPREGPGVNAITIDLLNALPPDSQGAFTPRPHAVWRDVTRRVSQTLRQNTVLRSHVS